MAQVHTEIQFKGYVNKYVAYIDEFRNILLKQTESTDIFKPNEISINREEWVDIKDFIDKQLSEIE